MNAPYVLNTRVDPTSYIEATDQIANWAASGESRYVCVANVHMIMEAYDSPEFQAIVNQADLVTPDGMPLVWMLRRFGYPHQQRVYGPDLTIWIARKAAAAGIPVGLYGGAPDTLQDLKKSLEKKISGIQIDYAYSPAFRELTVEENKQIVSDINNSGIRILFVGLGCPRQERWMAAHIGHIHAVMLGVGAAFDFHAGKKAQSPAWIQKIGMEWFFRLITEPRRLWYRYLYNNPRFVFLAARQLLGR
jgi:N-acetylglucosaminyldiphosphoundecaprenol N-acetyl-beta-D-mannosaminyltransferase